MSTRADLMRARLQKKLQQKRPVQRQQKIQNLEQMTMLDAQAGALFNQKDLQSAIDIYKQLVAHLLEIKKDLPEYEQLGILVDITINLVNTYYMLGQCYFKLHNLSSAKEYFLLAEQTNPKYKEYEIAYYLGTIFAENTALTKAEMYLKKAIANPEQDNDLCITAYINLANVITILAPKPISEALKAQIICYYQKAVAKKPEDSYFGLGTFYIVELKDFENGIIQLKKAAELKYLPAFIQLANFYNKKEFSIYNPKQAAIYFEQSAQLGDPQSAFDIAYLYDEGLGVPKNITKALHWYQEGVNRGVPAAMHNLGFKFLYGEDVDQDLPQAVELLTRAEKLGYQKTWCELGTCYQHGWGVKINISLAEFFFSRAHKQGITAGTYNLSILCIQQQKISRAIELWQELSTRNDLGACMNLGIIYHIGLYGIAKNFEMAEKYYLLATEPKAEIASIAGLKLEDVLLNLANLYLDRAISATSKIRQELLKKLEATLTKGSELISLEPSNPLTLLWLLYSLHSAGKLSIQDFLRVTTGFITTDFIQENQHIADIAYDRTISPEARIVKILTRTKSHMIDNINLAIIVSRIGLLYKNSNFNPEFIVSNKEDIYSLLDLVSLRSQDLDVLNLTKIIVGLSWLFLDPNIPSLENAINNLSKHIIIKLEDFDKTQKLSILQAITRLGISLPSLAILVQQIVTDLHKELSTITCSELADLLYNMALLEHHHNFVLSKKQKPANVQQIFDVSIYHALMAALPTCADVQQYSIIDLHKYYMALFFFCKVQNRDFGSIGVQINQYFSTEILAIIQQKWLQEFEFQQTSSLQQQVTIQLRILYPTERLQEEVFVNTLPIDILIGQALIQVDGPRHFLCDLECPSKVVRTPKDLFHNVIIQFADASKILLHIHYKEWETVVKEGAIRQYITDLLADKVHSTTRPSPLRFSERNSSSKVELVGATVQYSVGDRKKPSYIPK